MKLTRFLTLAPLQIAQAVVGFGAIAAFTRLMSADEFGRYALALSLSMTAHTLVFTWAEASAFRFRASARAEGGLGKHFATLIAIAAVLTLGAVTVSAAAIALAGLDAETAGIIAFAVCAAVLRFIARLARESDRAALRFTRYATLEAIYLVVGFAAGVAFLVIFDFGAAAPFAGALAAGVVVVLFDASFWIAAGKSGVASAQTALRYASYGAPLALALTVDLAVQSAARWLLASQAGDASLGAYAAAFGLARPLDVMFAGLGAALAPLVFAAYEDGGAEAARDAAHRGFSVLAALTIPACIGVAMLAGPLASVVVGQSLRDQAATALPWLALAGLFTGFSLYYFSEAFQLAKRTGERAILMLAPGALQIALTFWLSRQWGAQGAAMAATATALINMALLALFGRRHFALPTPIATLAPVFAASGVMALTLHVLQAPATPFGLALGVAAGGAAYAAAALMLDVLGARRFALDLVSTTRTAASAGAAHAD